jgi:hypothetical protein
MHDPQLVGECFAVLAIDAWTRPIASVAFTRRGGHGMKVKTKVKAGGFSWSR